MATSINASDRSILAPAMTVQAMRDSRYRHPANAIAELIDNSIDAQANNVELLVQEYRVRANQKDVVRIQSLAVLDDGNGMTDETLGQALRFGGRVQGPGVRKIGKYGMGLPTASASQCKRLDVWTWQNGIDNACHAYLDVNEVAAGMQQLIATDQQRPPSLWLSRAKIDVSDSGTLVVWSEIDRITNQAETIFRHLADEIGRTYRHYIAIADKTVVIRMAAFHSNSISPRDKTDTRVQPNDPLYLMAPSNTSAPWNESPMFEKMDAMEQTYEVTINGKPEVIEVTYSIVRNHPDAIGENRGSLPGNRPHGRHARRNMGVSIVRENREIVLDDSCVDTQGGGGQYPLNRWWGCEVRFGSGCDDLFGVDHNKQMVSHFSQLLREVSISGDSDTQLEDYWDVDNDPLVRIAVDIRRNIRSLMRQVARLFSQRPSSGKGQGDGTTPQDPASQAEAIATNATEEGLQTGETTVTPTDMEFSATSSEDKEDRLTKKFTDAGYSEEQAKIEASITVKYGYRYKFINAPLPGYFVFQAEPEAGVLVVKLNINHRFYRYLESLEADTDEEGNTKDATTAIGLRMVILALARMDDETHDQETKMQFQNTCHQWGRMLDRLVVEGMTNVE